MAANQNESSECSPGCETRKAQELDFGNLLVLDTVPILQTLELCFINKFKINT